MVWSDNRSWIECRLYLGGSDTINDHIIMLKAEVRSNRKNSYFR